MKKIFFFFPTFFLFLILSGCTEKVTRTQTFYEPVYLSWEKFRTAVKVVPPTSLQKPGKIYVKDSLIFINDYLTGIHIINNTDPEHPVSLGFIEIPGNVDMAVRNNVLYANSFTDLVALDISHPATVVVLGRAKDVFPYALPPTGEEYPIDYSQIDKNKGLVIDWEVKEVTEEIHNNPGPWPIYWNYNKAEMMSDAVPSFTFNGGDGGVSTGTGGSMARFTVYDKWLYALTDNSELKILRVDDPAAMGVSGRIWVRDNPQTIFQYDGKLFFGASNGMSVYALTDPLNPSFISVFTHVQSCDPVVVQGDYAYVTLHAGNGCGSTVNQLVVIDIADIAHPQFLRSYNLHHPYGLGIRDSVLYVCDGDEGLKLMNAENPDYLTFQASYPGVHAYDVIPLSSSLLMIGDDGLFQYRVTSPGHIVLISTIPVAKP